MRGETLEDYDGYSVYSGSCKYHGVIRHNSKIFEELFQWDNDIVQMKDMAHSTCLNHKTLSNNSKRTILIISF